MNTKQPKVILIDYPEQPVKNIALAVSAWGADNFFESHDEIDPVEAHKLCNKGMKAFHRTSLEYVNTIWVIKNVSRAFQQQLTRTRLATYSIQSMRVVTKDGFASNGHYTMPPGLDEARQKYFHETMLEIEYRYGVMLRNGYSTEDARGILPLNIHSDITMAINLNSLYHMLSQRFCVNTQWEFRQVAAEMKREVGQKMGLMFSDPMDAPCVKPKRCPMREEYCKIPVWEKDEEERILIYKKYINKEVLLGE